MSTRSVYQSVSFILAVPISDPGLMLHRLVVDHMMELGDAGGVTVWWRPIASPSLTDPIYRSLRTSELAKRDLVDARKYRRLCSRAGGEASYQRSEYLELARAHGISHVQRPAIMLVAKPVAGKEVVLTVAPSALSTAERRRELACFLYVELGEARIQQFAVDGMYTAESMANLQRHADKVAEVIKTTIARDKPVSANHWRTYLVQCGLEERDDPIRHTTASAWRRNGALVLQTTTDGKVDGKVEFALVEGHTSKQMQLMWRLLVAWPDGIAFRELARELYGAEFESALRGAGSTEMLVVAKRVRSLIHDIRYRKLEPAGINPDILPTILSARSRRNSVKLHLLALDRSRLGRSRYR